MWLSEYLDVSPVIRLVDAFLSSTDSEDSFFRIDRLIDLSVSVIAATEVSGEKISGIIEKLINTRSIDNLFHLKAKMKDQLLLSAFAQ